MTREGYGEAFHKGFARTIRFLQSRGASRDRAEEFAQAAWTKGWERLTQLRNDGLVGLWVNTIAFNQLRGATRRDAFEAPLTEVRGQVGVDCTAIDADTIFKRCHPREELLFKHLLYGFTTAEIAASLGASENAIRIRLLRARGSVRRKLGLGPAVSGKAAQRAVATR
jgi:DNA-directed RNA polymerase specialized sigma24 family protein